MGDIVKIGRGTWGLAEWYPGRNFKKKPAPAKGGAVDGEFEAVIASNEEANAEAAMAPREQVQPEDEDPWAPLDNPRRTGVFK